jgi:type IV pilus assembly protein PilA
MRSLNRTSQREPARNSGEGFSLIELLIVVAIILIIAAIAIPNFMRSRMAANEAAAVANLRDLTSAAVTYSSTYGNGYPPTLGAMGAALGVTTATCDQSNLIDSLLANGGSGNTSTKGGYTYNYIPGTALSTAASGCPTPGLLSFTIDAEPVSVGTTGQRGFFVDPSGVIRFTTDGSAPTVASPPLQ